MTGSISVSGQLPTYPSPNPTLTLNCCQLIVVELGEGWVGSCSDTNIDPDDLRGFSPYKYQHISKQMVVARKKIHQLPNIIWFNTKFPELKSQEI